MNAVVKHGGSAVDTEHTLAVARAIAGHLGAVVLVHGGGPRISARLEAAGIATDFVDGVRRTPAAAMPIVEAALLEINRELVGSLREAGQPALGADGRDGTLFTCVAASAPDGASLGCVGVVHHVAAARIRAWWDRGLVPVVAPLGVLPGGAVCNVNADGLAAAIAAALQARVVMITDVSGVLVDGQPQVALTERELERHIAGGRITGGMIAKARACASALRAGASEASIVGAGEDIWSGGTAIRRLAEERIPCR